MALITGLFGLVSAPSTTTAYRNSPLADLSAGNLQALDELTRKLALPLRMPRKIKYNQILATNKLAKACLQSPKHSPRHEAVRLEVDRVLAPVKLEERERFGPHLIVEHLS